jgi:nucleoid DNA-binding protein
MEIFKMDSITFIDDFMKKVMNDPELAKKEVKYIVKKIRNQIMEYEFEKDSDDVDLSDFGIF